MSCQEVSIQRAHRAVRENEVQGLWPAPGHGAQDAGPHDAAGLPGYRAQTAPRRPMLEPFTGVSDQKGMEQMTGIEDPRRTTNRNKDNEMSTFAGQAKPELTMVEQEGRPPFLLFVRKFDFRGQTPPKPNPRIVKLSESRHRLTESRHIRLGSSRHYREYEGDQDGVKDSAGSPSTS